jgi:hypothetical protein
MSRLAHSLPFPVLSLLRSMWRGARRVFDVVAACAVAGFIAIEIMGPASTAPAAVPKDTYTHVDIVVGTNRMAITPTKVPAGQIEFTVTDERPNASAAPVTIRARQVPGLALPAGKTLWTQRALHPRIDLVASAAGQAVGLGHINMVLPTFAAPRLPDGADRITIDVGADGMMTPNRDARLEQPVLPSSNATPPDAGVPWTTATPGGVTIAIRNHTGAPQRCALDDGSRAVTMSRGRSARIAAQLRAGGPSGQNYYSLVCTSRAGAARFDFWMS